MNILIPIQQNDVAPRFDLSSEIVIAEIRGDKSISDPRILLLPRTSGDELCSLIVKENVSCVVCGGIEEAHFEYLLWKKVTVYDGIIGPYGEALEWVLDNRLRSGQILPGAGLRK